MTNCCHDHFVVSMLCICLKFYFSQQYLITQFDFVFYCIHETCLLAKKVMSHRWWILGQHFWRWICFYYFILLFFFLLLILKILIFKYNFLFLYSSFCDFNFWIWLLHATYLKALPNYLTPFDFVVMLILVIWSLGWHKWFENVPYQQVQFYAWCI